MESIFSDFIKLMRQSLFSSDKTDDENADVLFNLTFEMLSSLGVNKTLVLSKEDYDSLEEKDLNTIYYVY